MGKTYAVLIIDMFRCDPESDSMIEGFPARELAVEYTRRVPRASLEELRAQYPAKEDLRRAWHRFGEDAIVLGGDYASAGELDNFIDHPATPEEMDWQAIKEQAGLGKQEDSAGFR